MRRRTAIMMTLAVPCAIAQRAPEAGQRAAAGGQRAGSAPARSNAPRANGGHIPAAPAKRAPDAKPQEDRRAEGHVNTTPHVRNDQWFGHDAPNDKRYVLSHPFEHGRFAHIGPSYRYNILRIDANLRRVWLPGGFFFEVAAWDWPLCADWCWTCGDDFVFYDDPDHPGWYVLYDVHTGLFVHAQYMGT